MMPGHISHILITSLGGTPIDYQHVDFVEEIRRRTDDGVDVVFDGIGGRHVWRSYHALRPGGRVITYGLTSTLKKGQLSRGKRGRTRGLPILAAQIGLSYLISQACALYSHPKSTIWSRVIHLAALKPIA